MGEVVSRKSGKIILKRVCQIFEELVYVYGPDKQPVGTKVEMRYMTNSLITNGETPYLEDDFLSIREVKTDDEVMKGYDSSIEAFRLEKLNLHKAGHIPPPRQSVNPASRSV